jgi:hypothetical protein
MNGLQEIRCVLHRTIDHDTAAEHAERQAGRDVVCQPERQE